MHIFHRNKTPSSSILLKIAKAIKLPLLRLCGTYFLIFLVAIPSIYIYVNPPNKYKYDSMMNWDNVPVFDPSIYYKPFDAKFNYTVLINVHSHTNVGGGQISPETSILWHIANGYNAMVVTDHNDIDNAFETQRIARSKYNDKIKVLVGEEWSNCRMHMGLIGIKEFIEVPKFPTDEQIQDVINKVHQQGGVVVVNHIPWSYYAGLDMPSKDQLVAWGVDYFDVTTGELLDLQTLLYAREKSVGIVAATDVHEISSAHEWTLFYVPPNNITEESIMDALRKRNTSFLFDTIGHYVGMNGETPPINVWYSIMYPWFLLGTLFHSYYYMDWTAVYSFVNGYCAGSGKIVVDWKAIWISLAWIFLIWLMLEILWAGAVIIYGKISLFMKLRKSGDTGTYNKHGESLDTPLLQMEDDDL